MFKDLKLSKDVKDEWQDYDTKGVINGIDISNVKVISLGSWPE
jgi:hypothetical protein